MPESRHEQTTTAIDALFVGAVGALARGNEPSAIDKRAISDARWLAVDGLAGDTVADCRHHGGAERALHHYPAEHHERWRSRYPGHDAVLVPGALGENLSTHGLTEADVCVGDIFTLGDATLELSQPRQPCWKMDARTSIDGLVRAVVAEGRAGWFYRVLEPGHVRATDRLIRVERAAHGITLAMHWMLFNARRPSVEQQGMMRRLAELSALSPEWRKRMAGRACRWAEKTGSQR